MTSRFQPDDSIAVRATDPEGELACDFTIATEMARAGLREDLARGIVPPPRPIDGGVEVTFVPDAWDAVRRYIDLESKCCSFLDLSARHADGAVLLTVTGRPEAQVLIREIFATAKH